MPDGPLASKCLWQKVLPCRNDGCLHSPRWTAPRRPRCRIPLSEIAMLRNTRQGFTLIELLVVVVIIGILAAIAIPKFANTKEKAYVAQMKSDLRNLVNAEEAFFADSVHYTAAVANLS